MLQPRNFISDQVAMGGRIQVLPEEIAQTIAAGEVVERPASVVKELMENAIDAGSTEIILELKGGGLQFIRIRDNGEGIEEEDVPLALRRYATSKIRKPEDLFALQTLGFRGEALPSIASVSKLALQTRVAHSLYGIKVLCEGGEIKTIVHVGCPVGTEVEVSHLFYNVPVKRKFLKSIRAELRQVLNHFLRFGLAYPPIALKLIHDGRVLQDLVKSESPLVRIEAILGRTIYEHLHPVEWEDGEIKLSGFASLPPAVKGNGEDLYFYINGRTAKDRIIYRAVVEAYRHVIPDGAFPVVVLYLTLPPSAVDVNVHPTKAEVKFRDPEHVFRAVHGALRALFEPHFPKRSERAEGVPHCVPSSLFAFGVGQREGDALPLVREPASVEWGESRQAPIRVLGQVHGTFLVCEAEHGLILIDQHAAHERLVFEKLKRAYEANSLSVNRLLVPLLMEVTAEEAFTLSSFMETFLSIGFEIDPLGDKSFAVRTLPSGIDEDTAQKMIRETLEKLALTHPEARGTKTVDTMLITLACHTAVRANQTLKSEEMLELVRNLSSFHSFTTCPHGRPIFFSLTWEEMNKQFKRNH